MKPKNQAEYKNYMYVIKKLIHKKTSAELKEKISNSIKSEIMYKFSSSFRWIQNKMTDYFRIIDNSINCTKLDLNIKSSQNKI